MIPPEIILQVSATMIIGILFIITVGQALEWSGKASGMLFFTLFGIVPFSITAILVLLDYCEYARWTCIASFVAFTIFLTLVLYLSAKEEK